MLLNSHYLQQTQPTLQVPFTVETMHFRTQGDKNFYAPFPVRNHPLKFVGGLKTHSVSLSNHFNNFSVFERIKEEDIHLLNCIYLNKFHHFPAL